MIDKELRKKYVEEISKILGSSFKYSGELNDYPDIEETSALICFQYHNDPDVATMNRIENKLLEFKVIGDMDTVKIGGIGKVFYIKIKTLEYLLSEKTQLQEDYNKNLKIIDDEINKLMNE